MRAEVRPSLRVAWLLLGSTCIVANTAGADAIPVNLSIAYQHLDFLGVKQEFWSRNFDTNYNTFLNPNLQLSSQLRLQNIEYLNQPTQVVIPYGDVRLSHPEYGITAAYKPTWNTNLADQTTHEQYTQFTGYVSPQNLPRVEGEFTRRRLDSDTFIVGGTNTVKKGRLSWTTGPLEVRGGVERIDQENDAFPTRATRQDDWDAGATYRAGHANWNFDSGIDYTDVRNRGAAGTIQGTRSASGNLNFIQRVTRRSDWNLTYSLRHVEPIGTGLPDENTQDGAITANYRPTRATQVLGGFGIRPVTANDGHQVTLSYMLATATAQGFVRPGWNGIASVNQTLNRQPDSDAYWTSSYRAGSRFQLSRGLSLDVDGTVTANGDTAVRDQKTTTQGTAGITANPLRPFYVSFSLRGYRAGPDVGHPVARSTSQTLDLRWTPVQTLELTANVQKLGALPRGNPTMSTTQLFARYYPTRRLQMDLNYSRSDQVRQDPAHPLRLGREVWTGRLLCGLGRRFRVSVGGNVVDPGEPTRSRQFDASFTARLGGGS